MEKVDLNLKQNETLVIVHIIGNAEERNTKIPIPDIRSNKPIGIHNLKDNKIFFFQKLLHTKINDRNISISIPNEITLSISISQKTKNHASILRERISKAAQNTDGTLFERDVQDAYDYLEEIQKSIVFSYKAVESFCNASIPEGYSYKKSVPSRKTTEIYEKEQIERWINTSEKISEIIPDIFSCASPSRESFWSDFKNLERLRNEIIHSKSSSTADILSELFSDKIDRYIQSSINVLDYFIDKDPTNQIFPLGFGKSQMYTVKTADILDVIKKTKKN